MNIPLLHLPQYRIIYTLGTELPAVNRWKIGTDSLRLIHRRDIGVRWKGEGREEGMIIESPYTNNSTPSTNSIKYYKIYTCYLQKWNFLVKGIINASLEAGTPQLGNTNILYLVVLLKMKYRKIWILRH